MENVSLERLADSWIEYVRSEKGSKKRDDLSWVFEPVYDLTHTSPDEAWQFILAVLARASDNRMMEILSAWPMEDLLVYHGEVVIVRVEEEAKRDPTFARLLGGVWKNRMSDTVWERVQAVWDRRGWDGIPEDEDTAESMNLR